MRCWLCGVEPDDVHTLSSFDGPVRQILVWPAGDHAHALHPPSPPQLEQADHEALMQIMDAS